MRTVLIALVIAMACLASGCASIVSGSQQSISVETRQKGQLVKNATCKLNNNKGTWYVNTPGSVTVNRSFDDLAVQCEKEKYDPGIANVKSSTKAMMFGNLIFGGIIGGAVDAGTGAGYDYPSLIHVEMGQTTTIEPAPADASAAAPQASPQPASLAGAPVQTSLVTYSKDRASGGPAAANFPPIGALWNYRYEDTLYRNVHVFNVRLAAASGSLFNEAFEVENRGGDSALVDANIPSFTNRTLGAGRKLIELAPYVLDGGAPSRWPNAAITPAGYPLDGGEEPFKTRVVRIVEDNVTVPAGSFKALRVEVSGERDIRGIPASVQLATARFQYTVWYAKDVHRYVMARHQQWNRSGSEISNELIQLVRYTAK